MTRRAWATAALGTVVLLVFALCWSRRPAARIERIADADRDDEAAAAPSHSPSPEGEPSGEELERRLTELRATEAELREELDALRATGETREHFVARCSRHAGQGCPLAHPPQDVLEARARCGTIVWDDASGPRFHEGLGEELGITDAERQVLVRVAVAIEKEIEQAMLDNWRRVIAEEPPGEDAFPSRTAALEIELGKRFQDESASAQLAKEVAGHEPRPSRYEDRSPYYWHMRLRFESGDRLEEAVAADLGAERARELRMAKNGWGGATMYSDGLCRDQE